MRRKHPCPPDCKGKIRYLDRPSAMAAAAALHRRDGDRMDVYKCSFGGFHVGHRYPSQRRARQVMKRSSRKRTDSASIRAGSPVPSNGATRDSDNGRKRKHKHDYRFEWSDGRDNGDDSDHLDGDSEDVDRYDEGR